MGTSGGIGVKPGTLIVTERAFSPLLKVFDLILSGEKMNDKTSTERGNIYTYSTTYLQIQTKRHSTT